MSESDSRVATDDSDAQNVAEKNDVNDRETRNVVCRDVLFDDSAQDVISALGAPGKPHLQNNFSSHWKTIHLCCVFLPASGCCPAPESWLKYFFEPFLMFFLNFKRFSVNFVWNQEKTLKKLSYVRKVVHLTSWDLSNHCDVTLHAVWKNRTWVTAGSFLVRGGVCFYPKERWEIRKDRS